MKYNMRYFYDWEYGSQKKGGLVKDGEMALLHRYGEAKQYEVTGSIDISITWENGQRYDNGATVQIGGTLAR